MSELLFVGAQETEAPETMPASLAAGEILLGTLVAINSDGLPQVSFAGCSAENAAIAITTVAVTQQHIGRQVGLLFANGDLRKPIIIGIIHSPLNDMLERFSLLKDIEVAPVTEAAADIDPFDGRKSPVAETSSPLETLLVDGKRVVIQGQEEIVLSCGESSITLTKAGKILIRGKYLLSRSSGVNRILGGSVQVN